MSTKDKGLASTQSDSDDADVPKKAKQGHKKAHQPVSSLASASQRLLNTAKEGRDAKAPLSKLSQQYEKKKLKALAKQDATPKLTPEERRLLLEKFHRLPSDYDPEFERRLKKLANSGVVQLMNAIQSAVKSTAP